MRLVVLSVACVNRVRNGGIIKVKWELSKYQDEVRSLLLRNLCTYCFSRHNRDSRDTVKGL